MAYRIKIIGAGLAGSEAAWQCARRGIEVDLYEMRPVRKTPAHETANFAELVCSNSLKSDSENTAPWLLKEEMRRAGSLLMEIARQAQVPAGHALAVDRDVFARLTTEALEREPLIRIHREEVTGVDEATKINVIATGPLTSDALSQEIARLSGSNHLFFYDSISPIVEADSIDWQHAFRGSRWGRGSDDGGDYVNCPLSKDEYRAFVEAVRAGQKVAPHAFEEPRYFEGCLPIEVMADRGDDVLAFGPMKPVGLDTDAHAVVQLRAENRWATSYNLVGFQTRLTYPEQKRIFAMIPALHAAEYVRMGSIHRNSYIESWRLLGAELELRALPHVRLAGQITGVEGYIESTAMGLVAALFTHGRLAGKPVPAPPPPTAFGALYHHLMRPRAPGEPFSPTNINYGLLPPLEGRAKKRERRALHAERAQAALGPWLSAVA